MDALTTAHSAGSIDGFWRTMPFNLHVRVQPSPKMSLSWPVTDWPTACVRSDAGLSGNQIFRSSFCFRALGKLELQHKTSGYPRGCWRNSLSLQEELENPLTTSESPELSFMVAPPKRHKWVNSWKPSNPIKIPRACRPICNPYSSVPIHRIVGNYLIVRNLWSVNSNR